MNTRAKGVGNSKHAGKAGEVILFTIGGSSLGCVLVAQSGNGLCAVLLGGEPLALERELRDRFPKATLLTGDAGLEKIASEVVVVVEDPARELHVPIDDRGTDFQQRVWKALREIPVGTTATYGDIAKKIGSPDSVRAVGRACAANPLAVVIPCHRVVRSDGTMAGYRWGLERKRILLQREAHFQLS